MKHGWAKLSLWAAGLLAVRLAIYALYTEHAAQLPAALCHWDCWWYVHTAISGYDLSPIATKGLGYGQANWAFLPLYPLLIHVAAWTGLSDVQAGFVISNICFLGFMLLSYRYLCLLRAAPDPLLLFGFLVSFPYGIYFSLPYTESLYAALTIAAFLELEAQHALRSSIFSSLLGATRVTGILMLPAAAARLLQVAWPQIRQGKWQSAMPRLADWVLPLAIMPVGLLLFMAYLYMHVGNALAFIHIQAAWQRTSGNPFTQLLAGLGAAIYPGLTQAVRSDSILLSCCGIAGLLLSFWIARRGHFAEAVFLSLTVLTAASTGLISLQRFVLSNPVFLLFLFLLLSTGWRRRFLPYLIALSAALQLYFLHLWLHSSPWLV